MLLDGEKGCYVEHSSLVRLFLHDNPAIWRVFSFLYMRGEE